MKVGRVLRMIGRKGAPRLVELRRAADAARQNGDWSGAASRYRAILDRNPDRVAERVQLGHMLKEAGDFAGADEAYAAALALSPLDDDLHLMIGHLRKLQGNLQGASNSYRRALEINPGNVDAQEECRVLDTSLLSLATSMLRLETVSPDLAELKPDQLLQQGLDAEARSDWREAIVFYGALCNHHPGDTAALVRLGRCLGHAGKHAEAEAVFRKALLTAPQEAHIHMHLGQMLLLQGRADAAITEFRHAFRIDPNSGAATAIQDALVSRGEAREAGNEPPLPSLFALGDDLLNAPVVSFDLFDTLLRRRFIAANEVHDTVSAFVLTQLGRFGLEAPGKLTLDRYTTTDHLKTSPHFKNEEPSLVEVWTELVGARIGWSAETADIAKKAARFEYDLELENLAVIDGAVQLLERLKAQGKRIIAISDMYFSGKEIETILRGVGLLPFFEQVFVSCDLKATKQSGSLFRHVCTVLDIRLEDVVHVGDNHRSDVFVPRQLGMRAVYIEQPLMTSLERPRYGHRDDLHAEIADLVKIFNFKLRFQATNSRADQIYFLSRDGCLIRRALEAWNPPIMARHFPPVAATDLFLSRASSCWLGLNFQGDWLLQAIGFAFWLHHGKATAREISDLLGISEAPQDLGTAQYQSSVDTSEVVSAYKEAGLVAAIKASLLRKRSMVERYLVDAGFFSHSRVVICDVGYSGTVLRDLNIWLLQESVRSDRPIPPRIDFHVIATNGSYGGNAAKAVPYVFFAQDPILPAEEIPVSLQESFAWLEVFFKHPTYGPLLGYAERDGRVMPDFEEGPDPGDAHPSAHILPYCRPQPSDIALLWMAAISFYHPFTDALLNRFANPDAATLAQMAGEFYEADAVTGATRSTVLAADGMSTEDVILSSRTMDYWVPGSIRASETLRQQLPDLAAPSSKETAQAMAHQTSTTITPRGDQLAPTGLPARFDPVFYRDFYEDVRWMPDDGALEAHYAHMGRREGRYPTSAHLFSALKGPFGSLPRDFDHTAYLWANPDLEPHDPPRWHAAMHFLKAGRREGRSTTPALPALDAEFESLVRDGVLPLSPEERLEWDEGRKAREIIFARHGVGPGPWIDALDLAEFTALNASWCGMPSCKASAIEAFLREGIARLAPLSLAAWFDPAFYRETAYGMAGLSDEACYRSWLTDGSVLRKAPSEGARMKELIGSTEFPSAFRWQAFRDAHRSLLPSNASRLATLEALLALHELPDDSLVAPEGAAVLWEILGCQATSRGHHDVARKAYEKALLAGGPAGRLWHLLGDTANKVGKVREAIAAYKHGIASPMPDRWSYVNGIHACSQVGAISSGLEFLDAATPIWKDMEPLRRARAKLMQVWFSQSYLQHLPKPEEKSTAKEAAFLSFIDSFAERLRRSIPSKLNLVPREGRVVVLTGCQVNNRALAAAQCIRREMPVALFPRHQVKLFTENLLGASVAIIHDVDCDPDVLEAILRAKGMGLRTVFWRGALGKLGKLDLSDLVPLDAMHGPLRPVAAGSLASSLLARFCDFAIGAHPAALLDLSRVCSTSSVHRAASPWERVRPATQTATLAILLVRLPAASRTLQSTTTTTEALMEAEQTADDKLDASDVLASLLEASPALRLLIDGAVPQFLTRFGSRVISTSGAYQPVESLADFVDMVVDLGASAASGWVEAATAGIPAIIKLGPEPFGLEDGVDVVKVTNLEAAIAALRQLLAEPSRAQAIGAAARRRLEALFPPVPEDAAQVERLPRSDRKRILYANVFFPPQVIGGATRVLSDNIDTLLGSAAADYDIAALTADDENDDRGAQRCDTYRGIPVFRMATPQEIDMDWRLHNAEVGAFTRRVIASFEPDLVHIHCLPRLSAALAEVCQALGKPYIITLHDAWWLSDFPFLVDEEGRPTAPCQDPLEQSFSRRIGLGASLERSRRLRHILRGATALLSVSQPFAEIYRKAGFDVQVVENGVSPLPVLAREPAKDRVRLGHLGGLQHHKGAYLIEAVLRTNHFDNLSLTIVELGRSAEDEIETRWGNTPVTITGKRSASDIPVLYSQLDVLLAPSIWPESFGLVSREAVSAGLWVVASDQGAMGDVIQPGVNGYVIDVKTTDGLLAALKMIDANPSQFKSSPQKSQNMRSADEQGKELIRIYDGLLKNTSA